MQWTPGTRLGPHEILRALGAGGMGEVYLARDSRLEREVALKLLPRSVARDAAAVAEFRREALMLASLNHPNIATIHGFEELPDGTTLLVLEYVEGESLSGRLAAGALPLAEALRICIQIAQALEVAHERGIVHRDVKPDNVMLGPRGLVKVLDFGLAGGVRTAVGAAGAASAHAQDTIAVATESGSSAGTPGYMSPEQVRGEPVDERADVFAFGCVLFECLAGRPAIPGRDAASRLAATLAIAPDLDAFPAATPPEIRVLVAACIAPRRDDRPRGLHEVRLALEQAAGLASSRGSDAAASPATPHNLPIAATSFVGRENVLRECTGLLAEARLLTLSGLGGSGKSRLALRLAADRLGEHPDGVWFVDLTPVRDADGVVDAVAAALGVVEKPGRTVLDAIRTHVGTQRVLLLLDNCEEAIAGTAVLVTSLLAACPALQIVTTSREELRVPGEVVYPVPALPAAESMALFLERARQAQPALELDAAKESVVAEICRALDGIPLAVELAAARVRLLGVEQIRDRLGDRFRLLARPGAGPTRQQAVEEVIRWSHDHLAAPEQDLMRDLSIFVGGWTLERATAVCRPGGDDFETLDLLTRLVERSIVVVERDAAGNARYRFLESVWRFARNVLERHEGFPALRARHLDAYLQLAEASERDLAGGRLSACRAELRSEEPNLLAAFGASGDMPDGALRGIRLIQRCIRYWTLGGRYSHGRALLEAALSRTGALAPSRERAMALIRLAGVQLTSGDAAGARASLEEAYAFWKTTDDQAGLPAAAAGLSTLAHTEERYEEALSFGEEALALYEARGQDRGVGMILYNMAQILQFLGRGEQARVQFETALARLRGTGDFVTVALALEGLAACRIAQGDADGARANLVEACEILTVHPATRETLYLVEATSELAAATGQDRAAALLGGLTSASRRAYDLPMPPQEQEAWGAHIARVRARLGEDAYARVHDEGAALPIDDAIRFVRETLGIPARG